MHTLLRLTLILFLLSACAQPAVQVPRPQDPPELRPERDPLILPEAQVTVILESLLTRTPVPTPGPGQMSTPQVSALPPVQAELSVFLVSVEYLPAKTVVRVQVLPPADLFAAQTSVIPGEVTLEGSQGDLYHPTGYISLGPDLLELEFPPLEEEQGELILRIIPKIINVPASQTLLVDLRGVQTNVFWDANQTLTFGRARVEVNRMRLVEVAPAAGSLSGDPDRPILALEVYGEAGQPGGWQIECIFLELPPGVFQTRSGCASSPPRLEAYVELGIPVGESHPLLADPFELKVSASLEATGWYTLTWKR